MTTSAVLFVDLQEGLVNAARTQAPDAVRRGAGALLELARVFEVPTVASTIPAGPAGPPPLLAELEGLRGLPRSSFGAWHDPDVLAATAGADEIVLAGILIEVAVLLTALPARADGREVVVILDACAGLHDRTEQAAVTELRDAGVRVTSLASWAAGRAEHLTTPAGASVLRVLQGLL